MRKLHKLTPYQQEFAGEHINEVYSFLRSRQLPESEYYDVVIFGYLAAVQEYTQKPELAHYSFHVIARRQMKNSLCEHYTYLNRPMRKGITFSIHSEDTCSLDELLPNRQHNLQDSVADRMYAMELMSHLSEKEREVVWLKSQGRTYREIAALCGISPDGVGRRFHRLRCRLNQILAV